jgi:adenine/guanine phosphoribosyltransferase-like PRPP-binding protein
MGPEIDRHAPKESAMMRMVSWGHLTTSFNREESDSAVRDAVEILRPLSVNVLVVTGTSGLIMGTRVADALGCRLAVVRRAEELAHTHSGSAKVVEGWIGGRWIFFDDLVASGDTKGRAIYEYAHACAYDSVPQVYLGDYMYRGGGWRANTAGDPISMRI